MQGFTLLEVMVVMILAGFVTLGLAGFYISSQGGWLDASSQALAQRDATSIIESIVAKGRGATSVLTIPCSGEADSMVVFLKGFPIAVPYSSFWWSNSDSLMHEGDGTCAAGQGAMAASAVERFSVTYDNTLKLFTIGLLQVRSPRGQRIQMESSFVLYNAQ